MKKEINYTAIIITLILVVGLFFIMSPFNKRELNTITTQGNYNIKVFPDSAVVSIFIKTNSFSAEEAKNKNSEVYSKILEELKMIGFKEGEIQTENYNIYEDYEWNYGNRKFKGYVVSHYVKIETKDFDKIGEIIDVGINNGALINYINFELSPEKQNEYKTKVLEEATKDAKIKAESIASGLGKKIKGIVSVTTNDYYYYPYRFYEYSENLESSSIKEISTKIEPQNLEISAVVTAVFKV
ncbi:MAG: SIMPL domain-containing protein [Candidatus Pacearchaeota archaeon]